MAKAHKSIPYIVYIIAVALFCFILSRFCFQLALVQGESMVPTYKGGQFVFANKLEKNYEQGDIVLYESKALEAVIIKRIAAMPGDTIHIAEGRIYVNDDLYMPYTDCGACDLAGLAAEPITIPEGKCFLLGDNFSHSIDSRHEQLGLCDLDHIQGKIK